MIVAPTVEAVVVAADTEGLLERIAEPGVQAVVALPQEQAWLDELDSAIKAGDLRLPRTVLSCATPREVHGWLDATVPHFAVSDAVRAELIADAMALVDRQLALAPGTHVMFRALTAVPNAQCGFHVDTVTPRAPRTGLLRVYNGVGTDYVHPVHVTSTADFYTYMQHRERLVREDRQADLAKLDAWPAFITPDGEIATVPAGAITAFAHLDVRAHWSRHAKDAAWIHRSPLSGEARLVVSVTTREPGAR